MSILHFLHSNVSVLEVYDPPELLAARFDQRGGSADWVEVGVMTQGASSSARKPTFQSASNMMPDNVQLTIIN
jgi:hypothetical protein